MQQTFYEFTARVTAIDWALVVAVAVAGVFALLVSPRGGRYRGLPGWAGYWVWLAILLIALPHAPRLISFALLAATMFAALRSYFFVAPVRRRDRYAILAAYAGIPFALWPVLHGASGSFLAAMSVLLILFVPVLLAIGTTQQGLLDSVGRALLGVLLFVVCLAHLGLLTRLDHPGLPQLFGVLVLAGELPRRLTGWFEGGSTWWRPVLGLLVSALLAGTLGWQVGPWCGLSQQDAGTAGLLVAVTVAMGTAVSEALGRELELDSRSAKLGRGAFLDRLVPVVYAAPVFFHYINHYA